MSLIGIGRPVYREDLFRDPDGPHRPGDVAVLVRRELSSNNGWERLAWRGLAAITCLKKKGREKRSSPGLHLFYAGSLGPGRANRLAN